MPIPSDYAEIVTALTEKTQEGALRWEKSPFTVFAEIDRSKFSLWAGDDEITGTPFVAFSLSNADGETLDSWFLDESDDDYQRVLDLFKAATRHAHGVPARLKELAIRIAGLTKVAD